MSVLVFLEQRGDQLDRGALGVLAKATQLGAGEVAGVIVGGSGAKDLAAEAGTYGAATVYVALSDALDPVAAQACVDVLAHLAGVGGHDTVVFSNSVLAADVSAGLAARLGAGVNWDLVDVEQRDSQLVGTRLALGDSVLVEVGWRSTPRLAVFRAGSFAPVATGGQAEVREVAIEFEAHSTGCRVVEHIPRVDTGPSLEDAEVVVTGGMGLGGAGHFALAEELAQVLGGVVGATRAAVYAGWYPASAQVGQTGRTVSPQLYVALGVSGAVQHKVGMQSSKTIVSVNKDPRAPIFEFSDFGVVGDVHIVVPQLIELLRQRPRS